MEVELVWSQSEGWGLEAGAGQSMLEQVGDY